MSPTGDCVSVQLFVGRRLLPIGSKSKKFFVKMEVLHCFTPLVVIRPYSLESSILYKTNKKIDYRWVTILSGSMSIRVYGFVAAGRSFTISLLAASSPAVSRNARWWRDSWGILPVCCWRRPRFLAVIDRLTPATSVNVLQTAWPTWRRVSSTRLFRRRRNLTPPRCDIVSAPLYNAACGRLWTWALVEAPDSGSVPVAVGIVTHFDNLSVRALES